MIDISREEAKKLGQAWYYTNVPCSKGHKDKRYVSTYICYECKRQKNRKCNANNPESLKIRNKRAYEKHKDKIKLRSKEWAEKNRDITNQHKKRYKQRNRDKYLAAESFRNREKRRTNLFFRLSRNISKEIWAFLKGKKQGKTYKTMISADIEGIKKHLEDNFEPHMNWENYGIVWEVDHIKPLSWFGDLEPMKAVRQAWSLNNLQPLDIKINRSKCNRNCLTKDELYELYR